MGTQWTAIEDARDDATQHAGREATYATDDPVAYADPDSAELPVGCSHAWNDPQNLRTLAR